MANASLRLTVGRSRRGPIGTITETVKSVIQRRRLLLYLTVSDIRKDGGNSLLGNLWLVLDPAVQLAIYFFLVGMVLDRQQPAFALFLFSAILPWRWLSMALVSAAKSVRAKDQVMRQIAFPHIVLPIASLSASSASFLFGLVPLCSLYLVYPERLTPWILSFPLIGVVQLLWMLPLAILFSALSVFFRDISNLLAHALRIAFYISPALFSYDRILEILEKRPPARLLLDLNPMAWILTAYRDIFYEGRSADWGALLGVALASIPFTLVSIYLFRRMAPSFPKVL